MQVNSMLGGTEKGCVDQILVVIFMNFFFPVPLNSRIVLHFPEFGIAPAQSLDKGHALFQHF